MIDWPDDDTYYAAEPDPDSQPPVDAQPPPSWAPVDLAPILSGDYTPPVPDLLIREDGVGLLYRGLTHSFHGESESGKSLLAQFLASELLKGGQRVLYVDCESDPVSVVGRLRLFGATPAQITAGFFYVHPEADPRLAGELRAWVQLLRQAFDLVVIDGVTNALGLAGGESKDNDQVTRWMYSVPGQLATRTGAAVVLIDHVTKDAQTRGRYAIGGQAKLAALTGAAYVVEIDGHMVAPGKKGVIALKVSKDRPGYVRARSGTFRPGDRLQLAAKVLIDSTGEQPIVRVLPPDHMDGDPAAPADFRPTTLMEKVSKLLENSADPLSKAAIESAKLGNTDMVRKAVAFLVAERYVTTAPGLRNSVLHTSVKPYRWDAEVAGPAID
ncbi:MAG: AAA family ATPase [Propionicimonas sp.]|uniref:AAA family ATPase n=1 Tax=Propionicimonas sp. TaxID=1955623 RepID=UPI002B21085E|nr:AAA family ATPase [Propionicimonas sp.]MEA4944536.1 AAA family ATPase [Propionicimonas sp.]